VVDPTGTPVWNSLCEEEGILYAEIDLARSVEPKQFHDLVGSYNRFDIFTISVDRAPRRPVTFIEEARGPAHPSVTPDGGPAHLERDQPGVSDPPPSDKRPDFYRP
jgi:nitrilase